MSETQQHKNLVMRGEVVYFRARINGKLRWKRASYQRKAAFNRAGNPTDSLLTELDQWLGHERDVAEQRIRDPDAVPNGRLISWKELMDVYPEIARLHRPEAGGRPSKATTEDNVRRMDTLLRQMRISTGDLMDVATPKLLREWLASRQDGLDPKEAARDRRSANTLVRMASSCWADWTREYYRERGIIIPVCLERWPSIDAPLPIYVLPPLELRRATAAMGEALLEEDPAAYLAYATMRLHGMRPGDAIRSRWDWYQRMDSGSFQLRWQPTKTARGEGGRWVDQTVSGAMWTRLDGCRRRVCSVGEFVIPGSDTDRQNAMLRVNARMRRIGWKTNKVGYELRKLFISEVYNRYGLSVASAYSGDQPTTIQIYYAACDPARHPELQGEWSDPAPPIIPLAVAG